MTKNTQQTVDALKSLSSKMLPDRDGHREVEADINACSLHIENHLSQLAELTPIEQLIVLSGVIARWCLSKPEGRKPHWAQLVLQGFACSTLEAFDVKAPDR